MTSDAAQNNDAANNEQQQPQNREHLRLKVKLKAHDGTDCEVYFKVKKTTKLKKLMDAYCARVGKEAGSIRFLFDGDRIAPDSTPNDLGMEDEDEIDAMVEAMSTEFNFDEWIETNNFDEIKDILVRHDLNIRKNLSTQSRQFALFLSDSTLLAAKSHLIRNIVEAIQQLSFAQTAKNKNVDKSPYIVISEAEEDILKSLQSTLDEIKTKHLLNKKINEEYKNSIINMEHRKKEKMINTKRKIDSYFDKMFNEITSTKQAVLDKLHIFQQQNIDQHQKNALLSESEELIKTANIALSSGLNKCNHIIQHSLNITRDDRKKQIINISHESMREYNKMKKALKTNIESIENAIQENDSIIFDIDFEGNIQETQKIIDALKCIQLMAFNEVEGYGEDANAEKMNGAIKKYQDIISKQENIMNQQNEELKEYARIKNIYKQRIEKLLENVSSLEQQKRANANKEGAIQKMEDGNFSFLKINAKKNGRKEPNYKYESESDHHHGGVIWRATMKYAGVTVMHSDKTKKGAKLKCIRCYVHNYM